MTTPYARLEANRIDAEYGSIYPSMGPDTVPQKQYQPAQYAVQQPGVAAPMAHLGVAPTSRPLYTAAGVKQYAKKSKGNLCIVICCCICCLIITAGIAVAITYGIAAAQCAKPQFTGTVDEYYTNWAGVTRITVANNETLFGFVDVKSGVTKNNTIEVHVEKSAANQASFDRLQLTLVRTGSELAIKVAGGASPWDFFARLYACDKANITVVIPNGLKTAWGVYSMNNIITLSNINATAVEIKDVSGEITVDQIKADSIDAAIVNGLLDVSGTIAKVQMKGVNSKVHLHDATVSTSIDLEAVNGAVTMETTDTTTAKVTAKTVNGRSSVTLPSYFNGKYDVKSVTTDVSVTCSVCQVKQSDNRHKTGTVNGGTAGGDVSVENTNGGASLTVA